MSTSFRQGSDIQQNEPIRTCQFRAWAQKPPLNLVWKSRFSKNHQFTCKLNSSILQESFGVFTQNIFLALIPQFLISAATTVAWTNCPTKPFNWQEQIWLSHQPCKTLWLVWSLFQVVTSTYTGPFLATEKSPWEGARNKSVLYSSMLKVTLLMCGSGGQKTPLSSSGWCSVQLN